VVKTLVIGEHEEGRIEQGLRRSSVSSAVALFVVGALSLAGASASAQNVETDPLQCWWRTSAGAVRVGEPFTAVLTCAVLETDEVKVVVDEAKLEPSVVQFAPFETLGGNHAVDLRSADRRFFQYEYRLRIVAENMFGKDVALPDTKLTYRVQSRVAQRRTGAGGPEEAIAGRDQTYVLPPLSVRLLSLVPNDASDIRDASPETFGQIDQMTFRASLFTVIGGVLFAIAALIAVLTIVRALLRARRPAGAAERLLADGAILRRVGRELGAVQREREAAGWTAELAARALSALRILGTYVIGRRPARQPLAANGAVDGGALLVNAGWLRRKDVTVSGSVTRQSIAAAIARASTNGRRAADLQTLEEALARFTTAQYKRPAPADGPAGSNGVDEAGLDESLAAGRQMLRRVMLDQTWIMKRLRRRQAAPIETRVWSR
jgi:hypothetical protein